MQEKKCSGFTEKKWAFQYSEKDWNSAIERGFFHDITFLPAIYCGDTITAGEMLAWTNRLNEIKAMENTHTKGERVHLLFMDFSEAYRDSADPFVNSMFNAIDHEHFLYV